MLLYKLYVYWALLSEKIINILIILIYVWPNNIRIVEVTSDLAYTSPTPKPGFLKVQEALRELLQRTFYWYKIASHPNTEPILDIVGRAVCNFSRRLQKTPADNRWMIQSILEKSICRLITPVSYCTAACVNIAIKWSCSLVFAPQFCWLCLSGEVLWFRNDAPQVSTPTDTFQTTHYSLGAPHSLPPWGGPERRIGGTKIKDHKPRSEQFPGNSN